MKWISPWKKKDFADVLKDTKSVATAKIENSCPNFIKLQGWVGGGGGARQWQLATRKLASNGKHSDSQICLRKTFSASFFPQPAENTSCQLASYMVVLDCSMFHL